MGCSSGTLQPRIMLRGALDCRRIANVYFTLVAAISCTSLSPVRWANQRELLLLSHLALNTLTRASPFPCRMASQYLHACTVWTAMIRTQVVFSVVLLTGLERYISVCRPITTFLPLAIVLGVSMFKEALEDFQRFQADREVNRRGVLVYSALSNTWVRKQWRDIVVSPPTTCCGILLLHTYLCLGRQLEAKCAWPVKRSIGSVRKWALLVWLRQGHALRGTPLDNFVIGLWKV